LGRINAQGDPFCNTYGRMTQAKSSAGQVAKSLRHPSPDDETVDENLMALCASRQEDYGMNNPVNRTTADRRNRYRSAGCLYHGRRP
jgi:hypothetical protein